MLNQISGLDGKGTLAYIIHFAIVVRGMETGEGSGIGAGIYDLGDGIWDLQGDEIGRG